MASKMVKPILKKRAPSEKNSLDLDRPWQEQHVPGMAGLIPSYDSPGTMPLPRTARDVSFSGDADTVSGLGGLGISKPRYGHARSHSGASHMSVSTTASGGGAPSRPSVFVNPTSFQHMPRAQNPPQAFHYGYGHATSLEHIGDIHEHEHDEDEDEGSMGSAGSAGGAGGAGGASAGSASAGGAGGAGAGAMPAPTPRYRASHGRTASLSQPSVRNATLASSQRAGSFSDIRSAAPPLRVSTMAMAMAAGTGKARRGHLGSASVSSSASHTDLPDLLVSSVQSSGAGDSPALSALSAHESVFHATPRHQSSMSPLRSSIDHFPRLRSRSELDTSTRTAEIREARRKFEERERVKAEKHEREQQRKRERRDHKEAKAQMRKNSGTFSDARPSLSRKTTPTLDVASAGSGSGSGSGSSAVLPGRPSGDDKGRASGRYARKAASASASASAAAAGETASEKLAFKSHSYDQVPKGARPSFGPAVDSAEFRAQRSNGNSAKRKTQGYWNGFVLWLRTRLFRMSRS